jgi:putative nucleotidyltransferase with HDIG domain
MARITHNPAVKLHTPLVSPVAGTDNLPTLPQITARLLDALAKPNIAVSELADIIKLDPALSLNVMRLAQSNAERSSQTVSGVADAAQLIGRDAIAHLVRWSSTLDVFNTFSFCSPGDLTDFWAHSVKSALLAEGLAREINYHDPSGAFLAGLLHDIGKLLLLSYFPTKYKLQFSNGAVDEEPLVPNENLFDDDHASAGAALVRRWRSCSLTADAIHYHHHPAEAVAQAFPLVKVVYVANLLATADPHDSAVLDRTEVRMLEMSSERLVNTVDSANSAFNELSAGLGIDLATADTSFKKTPASYTDAHASVTDHVRDASLLGALAHSLLHAEDTNEALQLVEQALHAHFDVDRVMFVLVDSSGKTLEARGQPAEDQGTLTIPLSATACSPVLALTRQHALDSFGTNKGSDYSIVDDQIIHLLGREGMFCIPMIVDNESVGTMILGVDKADLANLSGQKKLLDRLSRCAASAVRQLQSQLSQGSSAQQDSLQSVLALTRRTVHEINNPLGIINNYLSVLGKRLAKQDVAHDEIRIIKEEILRVRDILATLARSSKEASVSLMPVDLNAVLSDLLALMKEDLTEHRGIQIHSHLSPSLPNALADRDILKQAIINLLTNSAEALPDGGNIHVETSFAPEDGSVHHLWAGSSNNRSGTAQLIIRDDGPGIPETIRSRLFQPFVSSKDGHEGLGLSIVHTLVERLNGTISCDPGPNSGTQFTICLPVENS